MPVLSMNFAVVVIGSHFVSHFWIELYGLSGSNGGRINGLALGDVIRADVVSIGMLRSVCVGVRG